jgi:hypothetical protein
MSDSGLSPDEVRAVAEVHNELGPEYRDAVVESFLEKIDQQVGDRIDARLAATRRVWTRTADPALLERKRLQFGAMVAGTVVGAFGSGLAVEWSIHYPGSSLTKALGTVWAIIAVIYIVYGWRLRRR